MADVARAAGDSRPFLGIPIAHKDIFCTVENKTTCASGMLKNFVAGYDATVVSKLRNAGFIYIGKNQYG